ncbi:cytochrome c-type biogenesis CcmH-like mitochondrial protein isoform X2 [Lactuca sativa]|uniref:cytochrome c-type biogenesis CcmH-like mitochondrial protein isoform X2 n=1 Tax=Lactuca sativa TaxID=4236 RepID=UPI000CD899E5|nr:cytochrome c-type biogenesis CcmH-like mitochondrial protein isoform X2 [Lactuca sativa]
MMLQLIRDKIRSGKSDKDIYKKLENDYREMILYAPKFDWQTAAFWLSLHPNFYQQRQYEGSRNRNHPSSKCNTISRTNKQPGMCRFGRNCGEY